VRTPAISVPITNSLESSCDFCVMVRLCCYQAFPVVWAKWASSDNINSASSAQHQLWLRSLVVSQSFNSASDPVSRRPPPKLYRNYQRTCTVCIWTSQRVGALVRRLIRCSSQGCVQSFDAAVLAAGSHDNVHGAKSADFSRSTNLTW